MQSTMLTNGWSEGWPWNGAAKTVRTLVQVYTGEVPYEAEDSWAYLLLDILVASTICSFVMLLVETMGRWRTRRIQCDFDPADDALTPSQQAAALQQLLHTCKDLDAQASVLISQVRGDSTNQRYCSDDVKQMVVQFRDMHSTSYASIQQLLSHLMPPSQSSPVQASPRPAAQSPAPVHNTASPGATTSPASSLASSSPSFGPSPRRAPLSTPHSTAASPTSTPADLKAPSSPSGSTGRPDVQPATDQHPTAHPSSYPASHPITAPPSAATTAGTTTATTGRPAAVTPAGIVASGGGTGGETPAGGDDSPRQDMDVLARGYRQAAAAIAAAVQEPAGEVQEAAAAAAATPGAAIPAAMSDGVVLIHTLPAATKTAAPVEDDSKYQICGFRSPWLGISRRPLSRRYIDYVGRSCGGSNADAPASASTGGAAGAVSSGGAAGGAAGHQGPAATTTTGGSGVSLPGISSGPAVGTGHTSHTTTSAWCSVYEEGDGSKALPGSQSPLASPLLPGPPRITHNVKLFLPVPPGGLVRSPSYKSWSASQQAACHSPAESPAQVDELVCVPDVIPRIPLPACGAGDDSDDDNICLPGPGQRFTPGCSPNRVVSAPTPASTPTHVVDGGGAARGGGQCSTPQSPQQVSPGAHQASAPGTPTTGQVEGEEVPGSPVLTPSKRSTMVVGVV